MKKLLSIFITLSIILSALSFDMPRAQAAFDYNTLCSDGAFISTTTLNAAGIQSFLKSKGSFLANFSVNKKAASQIIYEASRNYTLNPYTILAMLQKEQGLITGNSSTKFNQGAVDWAMGYGVPDSGPKDTKYQGFDKQVDNGAWQLHVNYQTYAANGSKWNVGKTMIIDGKSVKFSNRCTSAIYRYTPHLGTNFTSYFNAWNGGAGGGKCGGSNFQAQIGAQGPRTGAGAPGVTLAPNQKFTLWVNYVNTGDACWYQSASATKVRIGSSSPQDRPSPFMGGKSLRGAMVQTLVSAGQTATFQIPLTAPRDGGTYTETFQPVAEGIKWFGPVATWTFTVSGGKSSTTTTTSVSGSTKTTTSSTVSASDYSAQFSSQGPRTGAGAPGVDIAKSQNFVLWVNYKNTGNKPWYQSSVRLGMTNPNDRASAFSNNTSRRGTLVQPVVQPGQIGTFQIPLTAPKTSGSYTEKFKPVAENIGWFGDTASWTLKVK